MFYCPSHACVEISRICPFPETKCQCINRKEKQDIIGLFLGFKNGSDHHLSSLPCRIVPFTDVYYNIMSSVQEATDHSLQGGDCSRFAW